MKKKTITTVMIAAAFCAAFIVSCASTDGAEVEKDLYDTLDPVIEQTYAKFSERLTPGLRIALLPPGSTDKDTAGYVYTELYEFFTDSGLFDTVDRPHIYQALEEQEFQMSGMVDDDTAAGIGHLLGAQVVVFGDLPELGTARQRLVYRALEVETGRMLAISSERF